MTHNELNDDSYDSGIGEKYWQHVLEQVANGMAWEAIIEQWRGALSKEPIPEAVRLARQALVNHASELVPEMASL